jgi:hypothetical protein
MLNCDKYQTVVLADYDNIETSVERLWSVPLYTLNLKHRKMRTNETLHRSIVLHFDSCGYTHYKMKVADISLVNQSCRMNQETWKFGHNRTNNALA